MMEFDFSVADLQDLSEWPDSLEFDEFFDPSEVHEEPSAKRRRTSIDKSPKTHAVGRVLIQF